MSNIHHSFYKILLALLVAYIIVMLGIILAGAQSKLFKADLIVVLGNKVYPDGHPSTGLKDRLDKAIEVYNKGYAPLIFVSGGIGKEKVDESVAMANYLMQHGIPLDKIIKDGHGNNTRATAKNTQEYLLKNHLKSVLIVSQYYHISRSKIAFKDAGIIKIGQAPTTYLNIGDLYSIAREIVGYPVYYFHLK